MVHAGWGSRRLGRSTMLAWGLFAIANSTQAQSQSDVPVGAFLFSRDVPARAAQAKEPPGTPHYVMLDQTAMIAKTLGIGDAPLADGEMSAVFSGPGRFLPLSDFMAPDAALGNIPGQIASSTNQLSSSPASGTVGQIGAPLQAINQAMSALNAALSAGH